MSGAGTDLIEAENHLRETAAVGLEIGMTELEAALRLARRAPGSAAPALLRSGSR
jgi:hypothetical protein